MTTRLAFLLCVILSIASGCSSRSLTIPSPDNSMVLVTSVEKSKADPKLYLCVVFEIRDKAGKILAKENTHASDASAWNLSWISNQRIKLESSDIGTYFWDKQTDGSWKRNPPLNPNEKQN